MCFGQLLVAIGGTATSYKLVLIGRIVTSYSSLITIDLVGIMFLVTPSATNLVIMSGFIYYWYKGKNMGFPMSVIECFSLLSSVVCYLLMPQLYNVYSSLALPLWIGFVLCTLGLGCSFYIYRLTNNAENSGVVHVRVEAL